MAPKKIVYIVTTLVNCGPTNQLYNLVKYLPKEEFDIVIVTLFKEPNNSRYEDFLNLGIEIKQLESSRKKGIINRNQFIQTIQEIKPDIVHTNSIRTDIMCIRHLKKYFLITTVHSYLPEDYRWTYGMLPGKIITALHCKIITRIGFPVACSYAISSKLYENYGIKTYTVQNGIDVYYYSPILKKEKYKLRKKLGLDAEKTLFIFSGNLSRLKDPITVVKAFLKANISDKAQLILLGDGELMNEVKKFNSSTIKILGRVNNVLDYLRVSDVLVSASRTEGMPMAVLEGMSVGLPVLLSKIDAHFEIVQGENDIGDLFDVGNVKELSEYMRFYTVINLYEKGVNARKFVEQQFNAEIMSQGYRNLYKRALNFNKIRKN